MLFAEHVQEYLDGLPADVREGPRIAGRPHGHHARLVVAAPQQRVGHQQSQVGMPVLGILPLVEAIGGDEVRED